MLGIKDGPRIIGHLSDGDFGSDRLTASHPAVVERQAGELGGEGGGLRPPACAVHACSLDEQYGRTAPLNRVRDSTTTVFDYAIHFRLSASREASASAALMMTCAAVGCMRSWAATTTERIGRDRPRDILAQDLASGR